MVAWSALLLPTVLSAVLVFIASSIIHMVIKWHQSDYKKLANEDDVRAAIRKSSPAPGLYVLPYCKHGKDAASEEMMKKFKKGPIGALYVRPTGAFNIGPFLLNWFVYSVLVTFVAGYLARAVL